MKRIIGVVAFGLLVAGCATESSVKKQIDPLADRVTALEKAQASTNAKLDAQQAELAALKTKSSDASARADQSAKEAAAAADRADAAAQKATKAFELGQVKGAKKQ